MQIRHVPVCLVSQLAPEYQGPLDPSRSRAESSGDDYVVSETRLLTALL